MWEPKRFTNFRLHTKPNNKTVHRSIRSAVFDFRDLTGGCSVTVAVPQRNQQRPALATSTPTYVASCSGRAACMAGRHSAYPFASVPPRTYVASFQGEFNRRW